MPGCDLLLSNAADDHQRPVHNPGCDFNDRAAIYGASFFARVIETALPAD